MADVQPPGISPGEVGFMTEPVIQEVSQSEVTTQQFRSHVGHISRQSGVYFAGTILTAGLSYLFKIYLARRLGAEYLGIYALGMTLIAFIGLFNSLGLPQSAVRFVAAYVATGKPKQLHALIWRGAALLIVANIGVAAVLLTAGRWIAVRFYHSPALVPYLPLFAFIMLFGVINGFYRQVLAGYRDLKLRTLIVNFVGTPLNMLIAIALISLGFGLRGYLLAQICSAAMICVLLISAVRHFTPAAARFSAQTGGYPERQVWSFSAAMLGVSILEFLISQVDKVAIGHFRNARELGIYSVAAALVSYLPLILMSINQIFAPTIAHLHTRGEHAVLSRLFQSLTKWATGLTLPLVLVVMVFSQPLMRLFGPEFVAGWPILVIGALGQLVNCGVGSVGYILLMSGNEKRLMKAQAGMAAVMVILSAVLVPRLGILGAAIAAAITTAGINLWNLIEVRRALALSPYNRSYLKLVLPTLASIAVVVVLKRFSGSFRHDWLAIAVAVILSYAVFAALVLISGLDSDDRLIASAVWSRVSGALGGGLRA
jgi:O-antigen/teichoic acid export membrane protein